MSLLNKVANKEVFDFLRTITIKSSYFADKFRTNQMRPNVARMAPDTANPYIIHLAGEYVLDPRKIPVPDETKADLPYFQGYRKTKDTSVDQYKNYWTVIHGNSLRKLSVKELETISSPVSKGLYEIQPYVVKGIIDPITGKSHDQEYRVSQNIYDREGYLSVEVKNSDIFVDGIYDEMMFVTSLDTGQVIPFTLENFYADCALAAGLPETAVHTKTLEAYKIPGRYFDLLCERYPSQVDLIKAIVYRVPDRGISSLVTMPELRKILGATTQKVEEFCEKYGISHNYILDLQRRFKDNKEKLDLFGSDIEGDRTGDQMSLSERRRTYIVKAPNFTLLSCDTERLDETERISLKEHVIEVCDMFRRRWAVDEYNCEENYSTVLWSVLWTVLPVALIAKRYANIKTPNVSTLHMWDYLASKGLGPYKGYLTEKQTWFLYKNINYLLQHAGQQRALNILIDNILADYGITIKAKTVVLDTTKSLSVADVPSISKNQCATCARNGVSCFKNINNYLCHEWLGTKTLCKSEPVVLTEDFAGASKEKVINELIKSHGYDETAAEVKYKRSFIWKDDEVEAIKNDLDRDQIVDMTGHIDSLETMIDIEHGGGQEPVVNDDIVDEQRVQLRNMRGTYAPTKLLEMVRRSYNAKFSELFNRFITDTFLRFAPHFDESGAFVPKVTCTYKFNTTEGASEYIMSFGEMLAASYLSVVRENYIDILVDAISTYQDAEGNTKPLYEFARDDHGNLIHVGEDKDGNPVYLKKLSSWIQERFTDMMNSSSYEFAIPTKCRTTTAMKFGKPLTQEKLVKAYKEQDLEISTEFDEITNGGAHQKLISVDGTYYIIGGSTTVTDNMWMDAPIKIKDGEDTVVQLEVLGQFVQYRVGDNVRYAYYENNDEIAVIPTYFRWYYMHLNPDFDLSEEERAEYARTIKVAQKLENGVYKQAEVSNTTEGDLNQAFDPTAIGEEARVQQIQIFVDPNNGDEYRIFRMSNYLDVDNLIDKWVDVTGTIKEKSTIAKYIDSMFGILMDVYCMASSSGSIRVNRACSEFLDRILVKKFIHFDLTETAKTHDVKDGSKVAYYNEWVETSKELSASFKIIENLSNNSIGWNELSTAILNELLDGCTTPFASSIVDNNQFRKLKQLVLQLSSYRITIIEDGESGRECVELAGTVEDTLLDKMDTEEILYFDPIGDCPIPPRTGGYTSNMSSYGHIFVPSTDMRRKDGKTYYYLTKANSSLYNEPDDAAKVKLVKEPLAVEYEDAATVIYNDDSGHRLIRTSENGGEMVNIPRFAVWTGHEQSFDKYAMTGKSYFTYIAESKRYRALPLSEMTRVPTADVTDLPEDAVVEEVDGVNMCYLVGDGAYELINVGELLTPGKFYEIISLYEILGVAVGTPLLIMRNDKYDWFYSTGTKTEGSVDYPCGNTGTEYCNGDNLEVQITPDKFDLENDFSNPTYAEAFGTPVFRIAVPTTGVTWGTPVKSAILERYLQPTVTKEFVQVESREHVMLIEQIRDIDNELNEEE